MLRSVARVGGQLRLTVLGAAGTVCGFDTFWDAACSVSSELASPVDYPHHSLGDAASVAALVSDSGWVVDAVHDLRGSRRCDRLELWRWLWGSLPLRTNSGAYLEGPARLEIESQVRDEFFVRADAWPGHHGPDEYVVESHATLVHATATTHAPCTRRCSEHDATEGVRC